MTFPDKRWGFLFTLLFFHKQWIQFLKAMEISLYNPLRKTIDPISDVDSFITCIYIFFISDADSMKTSLIFSV